MSDKTMTQADIATLPASDDLNERVSLAIHTYLLLQSGWTFPSLESERLRRHLGLPPTHPGVLIPTYAAPDWSGSLNSELSTLFSDIGISYYGADNALAKSRWFVAQAMNALGMT